MFRITEDDRWLLLPKGFILFIGLFRVLFLLLKSIISFFLLFIVGISIILYMRKVRRWALILFILCLFIALATINFLSHGLVGNILHRCLLVLLDGCLLHGKLWLFPGVVAAVVATILLDRHLLIILRNLIRLINNELIIFHFFLDWFHLFTKAIHMLKVVKVLQVLLSDAAFNSFLVFRVCYYLHWLISSRFQNFVFQKLNDLLSVFEIVNIFIRELKKVFPNFFNFRVKTVRTAPSPLLPLSKNDLLHFQEFLYLFDDLYVIVEHTLLRVGRALKPPPVVLDHHIDLSLVHLQLQSFERSR